MKNNFIYFGIVIIFFVLLFFIPQKHDVADIQGVIVAGKNLKVDLTLTEDKQEMGLSGREELEENEGMLFIFERSGNYPFWMKDMNFPIDIIWFDENLKVIYIKKDARPELYPEIYNPNKEAKYVLEVVSGFSDKNNLKEGDKIKFTY